MGRALGAALLVAWRNGGESEALALVRDANEREDQIRIRWMDFAATEKMGLPIAALSELSKDKEISLILGEKEQHPRQFTYIPIKIDGGRRGVLELSESLLPLHEYTRKTVINAGVTAGLLAVIYGLVSITLGFWLVGRPMRRLSEKARQIGTGDLSGLLTLRQRDEIGELAREMNRMSNYLGQARERAATEAAARLSAVEQLRHADRLTTVGKLASGLAHELGTPLNVVAAHAKMIAKGEVVGAAVVESANAVHRQAERMTELIRQLLDFARRRAPQKSMVDLQQLTTHTLALLKPLADKRRVNLRLTGIEKAATHADVGQIEQALTNLVVNGIQAMPRGGDLIVDISPERAKPPADLGGSEAEYFRVSIRDSGGGIPNDVRPHIFEPFFTTKGPGEGAGLGLSVSHGLIREHAGWIAVESELGRGSSFSIYLPKEADAGSSADRRG